MVAYNQAYDFGTIYKSQRNQLYNTNFEDNCFAYHIHRIMEIIHILIVVDATDARIPITQENGKDMAIAVDPSFEDCIHRLLLKTFRGLII